MASFGLVSIAAPGCSRSEVFRQSPARESYLRLSQQMQLLQKMYESGKIDQNTLSKVFDTIAQDIEILENEDELNRLPEAERKKAIQLRNDAIRLLHPGPLCYVRGTSLLKGSDINKRLELMKQLAHSGKVAYPVLEKTIESAEIELDRLSYGRNKGGQLSDLLIQVREFLDGKREPFGNAGV